MEIFENRFEKIDNDLEIRFESLKMCFDEILMQTLDSLEKVEKFLDKKSYEKSVLAKKSRIEKDDSAHETCLLVNLFKNFPFIIIKRITDNHIGTTQLVGQRVILSLL
jgi:hypothetical protein